MTKEKLKELQIEIARLEGIDKRRSEYVNKLWSEEQKCTLPGCCSLDNITTERVTAELDAEKKLKKFYISGMAWIPSYRDFDQYDTTVEATSKDNALEVFNNTSMAKFMKYEPHITVCPPPEIEIPCSKEEDNEWANESMREFTKFYKR